MIVAIPGPGHLYLYLMHMHGICHSLPSADSRGAVVSFWQKNVHNTG